jgi:hypothetical protein
LSIEEASRFLDYTIDSLYQSRTRGREPGVLGIVWKSRVWFRARDLELWVNSKLTSEFNRSQGRNPEPVRTLARQLADEAKAAGDA